MYTFVDDSIKFKTEITHPWSNDEKDIVAYLGPLNSKLEYKLSQQSYHACQAINLGIGCWMYKRFADFDERFILMNDLISALWISTLNPLYVKHLPQHKGSGAVMLPMTRCCFYLKAGQKELWWDHNTDHNANLAQHTTNSAYLFRHVCPKGLRSKFDRWLNDCIVRLKKIHPGCQEVFDGDEEDDDALQKYNSRLKGVPIPPQALNSSYDDKNSRTISGISRLTKSFS
jgi:hypothetical protein